MQNLRVVRVSAWNKTLSNTALMTFGIPDYEPLFFGEKVLKFKKQ